MQNSYSVGFILFVSILLAIPSSIAYKMDEDDEYVHQYITNESQEVWELIPYEIKEHLEKPLDKQLDKEYTANDDDIITGSGEEDLADSTTNWQYRNHFWDPDTPNNNPYKPKGDVL